MQNSNTITLTLNPDTASSTVDFPQAGPRMQELVSKFKASNPVPEHQPVQTYTQAPKLDYGVRKFEELSSKEQSLVMERISDVDYTKADSIMNFASAGSSALTHQSEKILRTLKRNPLDNFSNPIVDVVSKLKTLNPKDIFGTINVDTTRTEWGVFSSISGMLSMRKAQKSMFQTLSKLDVLMKNIKGMQVDLKRQQIGLEKDISMFETMLEEAYAHFSEIELSCIALQKIRDNVQKKLDELRSSATDVKMDKMLNINKLEDILNMIGRRMDTMITMRIATFQSITQASMLISTDRLLCEKIDEINELVIPLWMWQYAITAGTLKQQEAVSLQKAIRGITSKVLTGNAQYLHDTMISAQKEISTSVIAIDDLGMVQNYIDGTINKVAEKICFPYKS